MTPYGSVSRGLRLACLSALAVAAVSPLIALGQEGQGAARRRARRGADAGAPAADAGVAADALPTNPGDASATADATADGDALETADAGTAGPSPYEIPPPPPSYGVAMPPPVGAPSPYPSAAAASLGPAAPPPEPPPDVRFRDSHVDRVVLISSGETHPKGTFFFTDYEIVFLQLGYAFADSIQGAITLFPPLFEDSPFFVDGSVKINVARTEGVRFGLAAGLGVLGSSIDTGGEVSMEAHGTASPTFCFQQTCRSSLTLSLGAAYVPDLDTTLILAGGAGLVVKLGERIGLLLELDYAYGNDDSSGDGGGALLANYGLRVSGRNWGLDAVFMRPLVPAIDLELLPLGIPGIAFTYRTDGSAVAPARPPVPR